MQMRGGGREEFPSPPGRSWLLAMAHGGLEHQAQASTPNLAEGRKVELWTRKQLFASLPGMQEQSRVAGTGAEATGSGALRGMLLTQPVSWGLHWERGSPSIHEQNLCSMLQQGCSALLPAVLPCAGGTTIKKTLLGTNGQCMSS